MEVAVETEVAVVVAMVWVMGEIVTMEMGRWPRSWCTRSAQCTQSHKNDRARAFNLCRRSRKS